jgi:hypothetical protein
MKNINMTLTFEELRLLATLASDQLFRRQFIDPKMPGYQGAPGEIELGKALLSRMQLLLDEARQSRSESTRTLNSKIGQNQ